MTDRGFACNELPIAVLLFCVLIGVGIWVSKLFGLHGAAVLVPPAALVASAVLAVVGVNVLDARRNRHRQ